VIRYGFMKKFEKICTIQYITLITFAIVLIGITLLCFVGAFIFDSSRPQLDNKWEILMVMFSPIGMIEFGILFFVFLCLLFLLPVGVIVAILSTIAFKLNKKSKWKIARILNLICTITVIIFAYSSSKVGLNPIAIILWGIAIFNIYVIFFNKAEYFQEIEQKTEQNNEG